MGCQTYILQCLLQYQFMNEVIQSTKDFGVGAEHRLGNWNEVGDSDEDTVDCLAPNIARLGALIFQTLPRLELLMLL